MEPPPYSTPHPAHLASAGGAPSPPPPQQGVKRRALSPPQAPPAATASHRTRPAANYPRKRAVSACLVCRGRKTKCDNQRPACGFCTQTGAECVYSENERTATFDAASLAILDRLSVIEGLLRNAPPGHAATSTPPEHSSPHLSSAAASPLYPVTAPPSLPPALPPIAELGPREHPKDSYRPSSSDWRATRIPIALAVGVRVEDVLSWPIFAGAFDATSLLDPIFAEAPSTASDIDNVGIDAALLADTHAVPELVQRFLRNVHTKNPILDAAVLETYVADIISQGGFSWNGRSCLVLVVCALGAISDSYVPGAAGGGKYPSLRIGSMYFESALRRLGIVLSSNSLVAVQCAFLAGVYRMYTMKQFAAWKAFNAASMACLGYLRTRVLHGWEGMTPGVKRDKEATSDRHFEQRIYWSCMKSELELCVELDISPSPLSDLDYPHAFPSPPSELQPAPSSSSAGGGQSASPSSASTFSARPTPVPGSEDELTWFYYLGEIALRKLEVRISSALSLPPITRQRRSSSPATATPPELLSIVHEFSTQIELWRSCLPAALRFPQNPNIPCANELLQYLRQRYWWNLSRLYRPFVYILLHVPSAAQQSSTTTPLASTTSLTTTTTTASSSSAPSGSAPSSPEKEREKMEKLQIREYAQKALAIDAQFAKSFVKEHRHHGAWLGLRAVAMNSLVLLATAKARTIGMRALELPEGWREGVRIAQEALAFWEPEVGDARMLGEALERLQGSLDAGATGWGG